MYLLNLPFPNDIMRYGPGTRYSQVSWL